MLHRNNQGVIVVRIEHDGILVGEGDVNSCFPLHAPRETMRYYICYKHMPCVFLSGGFRATSTSKPSNCGVGIRMYSFIFHIEREDERK